MAKRCLRYVIEYKKENILGRSIYYDYEIKGIDGYEDWEESYHGSDFHVFVPVDKTKDNYSWFDTYTNYDDAEKQAIYTVQYYTDAIESSYEIWKKLHEKYLNKD